MKTKPERSRFRRVLKWMGVGFCAFIVLAGVLSLYWEVSYYWPGVGAVVVGSGDLAVVNENFGIWFAPGFSIRIPENGWIYRVGFEWPPLDLYRTNRNVLYFEIWLFLAAFCLFTSFLFWLDQRRCIPPGHCKKCGYNLTGNTSGICSECGEPCEPEASAT